IATLESYFRSRPVVQSDGITVELLQRGGRRLLTASGTGVPRCRLLRPSLVWPSIESAGHGQRSPDAPRSPLHATATKRAPVAPIKTHSPISSSSLPVTRGSLRDCGPRRQLMILETLPQTANLNR